MGSLEARIADLEAENARLRAENNYWSDRAKQIVGVSGEQAVGLWLKATMAKTGSPYDLVTSVGTKVEVKTSSVVRSSNKKCNGWVWAKLFGLNRAKQYDRLILIGEADPKHNHLYLEPSSGVVLFSLSYEEAISICPSGTMYLSTNPKARTRNHHRSLMFDRYQTRAADLAAAASCMTSVL